MDRDRNRNRNRVAQLYPRAMGSLFVASYDSQGYGRSFLLLSKLNNSEANGIENGVSIVAFTRCHVNVSNKPLCSSEHLQSVPHEGSVQTDTRCS
jgi:hypothetical protein